MLHTKFRGNQQGGSGKEDFEGWSWVLIASVPDLCIIHFTFTKSKTGK